MPTRIAAVISSLGLVGTILSLAMINILWAIGSSVLMHFYLLPGSLAGGWGVEVAVSTAVALLVTIPADIILILLARSMTRQRDALDQLAHKDHLTGLSNRRHFEDQVSVLFEGVGMSGVLLLIDVDHFKQVNDQFGHDVGDQVLSDLGRALSSGLCGQDVLGRLGGEEFAVFLPHAGVDGALVVAERLRGLVERMVITTQQYEVSVTISLRVASTDQSATYQALYRAADEALYAAKRNGRNQVAVYDAEASSQPRTVEPTKRGSAVSLSMRGAIS